VYKYKPTAAMTRIATIKPIVKSGVMALLTYSFQTADALTMPVRRGSGEDQKDTAALFRATLF
jgi:hypothetical protein